MKLSAPRTVVLTERPDESHDIRVALGFLTTIRFDAQILGEAIELEGHARFDVDVGDQTIFLQPLAPLGARETRALRVSYRVGSPASVLLRLVADPSEVDTVVTVRRPPQSPTACQPELLSLRERYEAQGRELEQLKAQRTTVSPAALGLAGWVDKHGIRVEVSTQCKATGEKLLILSCMRMRASQWIVVVLVVHNTGQEPWAPTWAEFSPTAGGASRKARALLPVNAVIPPGKVANLAVDLEMPSQPRQGWFAQSHTLTLCDAAGRCLTLPNLLL